MLNSASFPNRYRVPKVSSAREPHATTATARSGREPKPRRRSAAVSEAMSRLSCAPHMLSLEHPVLVENRINGRRLGTARPFPLWRLHSGPQSSSVDQYSESPPNIWHQLYQRRCADRWLPATASQKKLDADMGRVPGVGCATRCRPY